MKPATARAMGGTHAGQASYEIDEQNPVEPAEWPAHLSYSFSMSHLKWFRRMRVVVGGICTTGTDTGPLSCKVALHQLASALTTAKRTHVHQWPNKHTSLFHWLSPLVLGRHSSHKARLHFCRCTHTFNNRSYKTTHCTVHYAACLAICYPHYESANLNVKIKGATVV